MRNVSAPAGAGIETKMETSLTIGKKVGTPAGVGGKRTNLNGRKEYGKKL